MQLQMNTTTKEQLKNAWAFAASQRHRLNKALVITACSKEARTLGIQVGMRYEDAKQLIPELRILVYRGARHA